MTPLEQRLSRRTLEDAAALALESAAADSLPVTGFGTYSYQGGATWSKLIGDAAVSLQSRVYPTDALAAMQLCLKWGEAPGHWFIRALDDMRVGYANYGLEFRNADGTPASPGLQKWLTDPLPQALSGVTASTNPADPPPPFQELPTRAALLRRYVAAAWRHRFIYTNVVTLWYTPEFATSAKLTEPFPLIVRPTDTTFYDDWGLQRILWNVVAGTANTPDLWTNRPRKNDIRHGDEDFDFAVLKEGPLGRGFDWPKMAAVFQALSESDSHEAADIAKAIAERQILRLAKVGALNKSSTTGLTEVIGYSPKRRDDILTQIKGKSGLVNVAERPDFALEYVYLPGEAFDVKRWENVVARLRTAYHPWADMLLVRGTAPFLLGDAQALIAQERSLMGDYLANAINRCCVPPENGLSLHWSDRCFWDSRQRAETAKYAQGAGALSIQGLSEEFGFDYLTEMARKQEEMKDPALHLPLYDPNHGPAKPSSKPNGKPAGTGDPNAAGAAA